MCTAKLYGHSTDNALCTDTRTNTKYWKVWQLTDSGQQHLQHHWLIPDRFLKRISVPICTTTARTCQQDCHYCSVLQLSVATTVIILSTHVSTFNIITVTKLQKHNRTVSRSISLVPHMQNHTQQYIPITITTKIISKSSSPQVLSPVVQTLHQFPCQ